MRLPDRIPGAHVLEEIRFHVRSGGLLAYPTETVYGFGSLATGSGLEALTRLKRRDGGKPFLLLVPEAGSVSGLGWTDASRALARAFWPGPLTLVLSDPGGSMPAAVRGQGGGVAVRVSPDPTVQALLEAVGAPITSTSANAPGEPPATSGDAALEVAVALGGGEEVWVLDVGKIPHSEPSTIIDCTGSGAILRRPGAIPRAELIRVVPELRGP